MTTSRYSVSGMTCSHCEQAIRSEVSDVPGVQSLDVSAGDGVLTVTGNAAPEAIVAAVDETGYVAVPA